MSSEWDRDPKITKENYKKLRQAGHHIVMCKVISKWSVARVNQVLEGIRIHQDIERAGLTGEYRKALKSPKKLRQFYLKHRDEISTIRRYNNTWIKWFHKKKKKK